MSSPRSEATSDVSVGSHWQDVLGVSPEVIQRLSFDKDFQIVVQNLNEYISTNAASVEEYEQTLRDLTATIEERNKRIEQLNSTVEEKDTTIDQYVTTAEEKDKSLEQFTVTIKEKDRTLQSQEQEIESLKVELSSQSTVVEELNKEKTALDTEVQELQAEVENKAIVIIALQSQLEDANERLKPLPSVTGDRETLLRLLDRRQQEIDHLTDEWRNMLKKVEMVNAEKSSTQSKLDEIVLQDSSVKLREQLFEQEKKLLQSQNEWLNNELDGKSQALLELQKERAQQVAVLESEALRLKEEVKQLSSLLEASKKSKTNSEERLEELRALVSKSQEENAHVEEQFRKEITAQSKLAELYKSSCEEAEGRVQELVGAIERQQKVLETVSEEKITLEEELANADTRNSSTIQELNDKVTSLTSELQKANELLSHATSKSSPLSHGQLAEIFPTAAATSSLMKSGMTLTQIYSKYAEVSDELIKEKEAKQLVQNELNYLIQELQDRTPVLQKQREDLDRAVEENKVLKSRYDNILEECEMLRLEADDSSRHAKLQDKENERLKKLVADLSKQVQVLLQECENANRGGGSHDGAVISDDLSSADVSSSSEVISGQLVSFRNITELQEQNQRLLMVIRDLSEQQEQREQEMMDETHIRLKEQLKEALDELDRLREARERQKEMVKAVANQRDMYQRLLAQATPLPAMDEDAMDESDGGRFKLGRKQQQEQQQKQDAANTASELKELRERFDDYRKERAENEKILRVQVEEYREDASKLRLDNATIVSKLEFTVERLKNVQSDFQDLKHENSTLKQREKVLSSALDKHETSHRDLFQELLTSRAKLSKSEAMCDNLRAEKELISKAEVRATQLYQSLLKEQQNQNLVLVNLQTIQNNMERSEFQTRTKLEAQVASLERELTLNKKKLEHEEEERDKRRDSWEQRLEGAQGLLDAEKASHVECQNQLQLTKEQLAQVKEELSAGGAELEKYQTKLQESEERLKKLEEDPKGELQKKIRILEKKLADVTSRVSGAESELTAAKQNAEQYQLAAQANEEALRDLNLAKEQYEEQMNKTVAELEEQKNDLSAEVQSLQEQKEELQQQTNNLEEENGKQVSELMQKIADLEQEVAGGHSNTALLQEQLDTTRKIAEEQTTEKKKFKEAYDRELMNHGNTMQELVMVKQQLETEQESLAEAIEALKSSEEKMVQDEIDWKERLTLMEAESQKAAEKYRELLSQNERLHGQAEQLTSQLKVLQRQAQGDDDDNLSSISGFSTTEKTAEELWDIIRYIRREKQISDTKTELAQSQKVRLQESCDHLQRKLAETEKLLVEERERNTMSMKSAEEHAAILAKVEQLNLLSDSNKLLREQKNKLDQLLETSRSRVQELEGEIQPLKESVKTLTVQKDALVAEKTALKNEVAKWNARTTQLIERYNQVDPDEYKQLIEERETRKQELAELKTQLESVKSEFNTEQESKKKLETELNAARQSDQEAANVELKQAQDELTKSQEELAKSEENIKSKTAVVQKLQKVGRSYRMKFEETKKELEQTQKELEQLKESSQSKEAATAAATAVQRSSLEEKVDQLEKENKELKESLDTQKASATASENKVNEMKRTMKVAMQRLTNMKGEKEKLDLEVKRMSEERTTKEQQLEEMSKKLESQKTEHEERISSLEERLRYFQSPKQEGRLVETASTATQSPATQAVSITTPMATVKPTTSIKHSTTNTRVTVTPTASIRPLATTTQTPTAAVTPTPIPSTQQQASVAPVAPVTTVTTVSVPAMDTGMPVSSAAVVTSGEPPSITTTTTAEAPTVTTATVSSVEPVTSVIPSGEVSSSSRESSASSHQDQPQSSSPEPSAVQTIQPPVALKNIKVTSASITDGSMVPSVNIVRMRHPALATVGAYSGRVTIKRRRAEEDEASTDQEGSSVDSKKLKQEVEDSSTIVSTEEGSTAGPSEEQFSREEEQSQTTATGATSTDRVDIAATTTNIGDDVVQSSPVAAPEVDSQQSEAEPMAIEGEAHKDTDATAQETTEQVLTSSEQPVVPSVTDDGGSTVIMSSATSDVVVEDDDGGDQKEDEETKPEDNEAMEEVVRGEDDDDDGEMVDDDNEEEEEDEEEEEEEEEDIEVEQLSGFEVASAATTEVTAEGDTGLSKSDPIELSSDEETDRVPAVMLSSAAREGDVRLPVVQDEDSSSIMVLSVVDEMTDAASSYVDVVGELDDGNEEIRDEEIDIHPHPYGDVVTHYASPLQLPMDDNLVPLGGHTAAESVVTLSTTTSSSEVQPQANLPRHVRPHSMSTRLHPTSLQEDSTDRLVPHTPVYTSGDQSLATHVLAPSVPVSDQPRMVTSQSANSAAQVAVVPSLEAGDMLLMHGVADQSARDEPRPSSEVVPPSTIAQPPISEVTQPDDDVSTQMSSEVRSPEEGELDDTEDGSSIRIPSVIDTEGESSSVSRISVIGSEPVVESSKDPNVDEGSSMSRIPSTTQQSGVASPKPSTSTTQTAEKKPYKRKVEPIVWDKVNTGPQAASGIGRDVKVKRGEPTRRGRGAGRGGRKPGGLKNK